MFIASLLAINLALALYTIGVWAERVQGVLKPWHTVFFGLGLLNDTVGTLMMTRIAAENQAAGLPASGLQDLMAWTGTLAILLMAVHFVWALVVVIRNRERERTDFHRFSVVVWAIWLVPYAAGAAAAMLG